MKEFDYSLDYQNLDFTDPQVRKLYRIGRGEQGVLLVRPYTNEICKYWRFKDENTARQSSTTIYKMFCGYKERDDFIGMDMARKFLEMGFTRARRYANHRDGRKYGKNREVLPQESDALVCEKAKAAQCFKALRDQAAYDPKYVTMRKVWRTQE